MGLWGTCICGGEILESSKGLPESAYLKHAEKDGTEEIRIGCLKTQMNQGLPLQ